MIISSSDLLNMKICVIHLNQIGDLVFSLPLLQALRDNYPTAVVHSVLRPYLQDLLKESPLVNTIIPRPVGISNDIRTLLKLRKTQYDLVICLARSEAALLMTAMSKSRMKAGFRRKGLDLLLDVKVTTEGHNSWYNNARLLKALGIVIKKNNYVGLLRASNNDIDKRDLPQRYAVISPGTSRRRQAKAWKAEGFAEVISRLYKKGISSIIVGAKDEWIVNEDIRQKTLEIGKDVQVINLSGKLGLGQVLALLKNADIFVGIDSGIMHLASALDIPTVGIFGPTDPFYVGPQNKKSIVVRREDLECVPCYLKPCRHRKCLEGLEADAVYNACERLIS